jgi:hypothetical protein
MRHRIALLAALGASLVALYNRSALQSLAYGLHSANGMVGRLAPELPSLRSLDGHLISLAALRGRVVLLHFWTFD